MDRQSKKQKKSKQRKLQQSRDSKSINEVSYITSNEHSENDDSDTEDVTISLSDLRNIVKQEVKSVLTVVMTELKSDIAARMDDLDINIENINSTINSVDKKVDKVMASLTSITDKNKKTSVHPPAISESHVAPIGTNELQTALNEINERESIKDNIVIFNVKDDTCSSAEEKKQTDITAYHEICATIDVPHHEIKAIFRIGKPGQNKVRPLIVKINNDTKKIVFKNIYKLKNNSKKWVIKHDLTRKEQETEKKLWQEVKRRRETGENCFIKNGTILSKTDVNNRH
jgi:hypothetical protein